MPPITPVPIAAGGRRPAPVAIASGSTPRMKASEVIRIGRKRRCAPPASVASTSVHAAARVRSLANSTIRIAFFAARPMIVSRPTWK